jgi:prepilin-type N-terminal cleavage/methylation domain-containing protein
MIVSKNKCPQDPFVVSLSNHAPSIRSLHSHSGRTAACAGFTLIEVLLAMAIIGLVLTPIFMGQSAVLRAASLASRRLARVFAAKKILIENEIALDSDAREFSSEKKIDNPRTTFNYELKKISDESSLKKFKNVLIESVSWIDERSKKKRQERLITFLYRPEQQ